MGGPAQSSTTLAQAIFYVTRFGIAGAGVGLFFFLSSQAKQHRIREEHNRRFANELTTLMPFLSEIPDTADDVAEAQLDNTKRGLLIQAARDYFAGYKQGERSNNDGENSQSDDQLAKIMKLIRELDRFGQ